MALNFSHRPIFPGPVPKDNVDAFGKPWHLNPKWDHSFLYGRETYHGSGSEESVPKDVLDLLPLDPFGMDISSTFTAITDWLEDFGADCGGYGSKQVGVSKWDCQSFAGLNFIWSSAVRFQMLQGNRALNYEPNAANWCLEKEVTDVSCYMGFGSACNMEGIANGHYLGNGSVNVPFPMAVGSACSLEGMNGGYSSEEKAIGDVSSPIGFQPACNMEGVSAEYCSEKKAEDVSFPNFLVSACNTEGVTTGYPSEKEEVGDLSCLVSFGSTCDMELEGITSRCCSEEEVRDVPLPLDFGDACNMEETSSGCLEEKGVRADFGPACNIEEKEITSPYGRCSEKGAGSVSCPSVLGSACNKENVSSGGFSEAKGIKDCSVGYTKDIMRWGDADTDMIGDQNKDQQKGYSERLRVSAVASSLGEDHHLVWGLVIGCLGVQDLLSVGNVCRYLRATVKSEPYLWTQIHIGHPLNEKITDDLLLQLTGRAQGELQYLSLVGCTRITDDGLKRIVESNLKLTKLSVPGCTKLSIKGIVNNLKALKSMDAAGIKHLKIGAFYSTGLEDYIEELQLLLGIDSNPQHHNVHKPRFYHVRQFHLSCDDDDRALDIETCPRCEKLRLIYDCTAEGCQRKEQSAQACRACRLCIERCYKCGRCIKDGEYEETFCLDWLCSVCKQQEDLQACL